MSPEQSESGLARCSECGKEHHRDEADEVPDGVHRIDCPDCDWQSREFEQVEGEIAAQVDAELHYIDEHGGRIPDDADFGHHQCPDCFDTDGFNGTVSCSECGFVPKKVRA